MEQRKPSSQKFKSEQVSGRRNPSTPLASTGDESLGNDKNKRECKDKQNRYKQRNALEVRNYHKEQTQLIQLPKFLKPPKAVSSSPVKEESTGPKCVHRLAIPSCSFDYSSDFPALTVKHRKSDKTDYTGQILERQVSVNMLERKAIEDEESNDRKTDNSIPDNELNKVKVSKKVPRTERPITVDLMEASELFKMKKLQSKSISKKSKILLKRRDQPKPYGGNILDSDQPLRHKGKIRLNKKRRLTKIKSVILEKRHAWKTKKSEWKSSFQHSKTIQLDADMIKDVLVLKSCDFSLSRRVELPSSGDPRSLSFEDDKNSSEIVDCKTQVNELLITNKDSIEKPTEKDLDSHEIPQSYLDSNLNIIDSQVLTAKRMIHSKRFAIYCDQWPIKELTDAVNELLKKLDCFQQKMQACDPLKLYSKRRFNLGLTEVTKYLRLGKIVMIIFATDIEEIDGKGGLLDTINSMTSMASLQKVPYVFANTQKKLKGILKKNARISCIGIRNYEGADTHFKKILELLPEAKRLYKEKLDNAEKMWGVKNEETESDPNVAVVQSLLSKLTCHSTQVKDETNSINDIDADNACPFLSAIMKNEENTT